MWPAPSIKVHVNLPPEIRGKVFILLFFGTIVGFIVGIWAERYWIDDYVVRQSAATAGSATADAQLASRQRDELQAALTTKSADYDKLQKAYARISDDFETYKKTTQIDREPVDQLKVDLMPFSNDWIDNDSSFTVLNGSISVKVEYRYLVGKDGAPFGADGCALTILDTTEQKNARGHYYALDVGVPVTVPFRGRKVITYLKKVDAHLAQESSAFGFIVGKGCLFEFHPQ
jgi:hypothetical protein